MCCTADVNEFKLKVCSATSIKGTLYPYEYKITVHYNGTATIKLEHGEGMQLWSKCSLCSVKQNTSHLLTTAPTLSFCLSVCLSLIQLLQRRSCPTILISVTEIIGVNFNDVLITQTQTQTIPVFFPQNNPNIDIILLVNSICGSQSGIWEPPKVPEAVPRGKYFFTLIHPNQMTECVTVLATRFTPFWNNTSKRREKWWHGTPWVQDKPSQFRGPRRETFLSHKEVQCWVF